MSESIAPVGERLEQLVGQFLRTVPETWTEFDPAAQSELEGRALNLLTAAGMIERRATLRLRIFGHPVAVEATITLTGEGGFAEAVGYVSADMWEDWRGVFEARKASDLKDAPTFHCERIGKEQRRLTAEGVIARHDLDTGEQAMVFDFVLRRGFFDGQPRLMPDGRISRRLPVVGKGTLERIRRVRSDSSPADVNIANWDAGGEAFAAAFDKLFMNRVTESPAPSRTKGTKRKGGTERGDGRVKLIAALTKHHQYADGGCLNQEPIGNNELAREAGVSRSTASAFFDGEFQGHTKYKVLCRDIERLTLALKLLNGDIPPHNLYGRRPADEDERDDE